MDWSLDDDDPTSPSQLSGWGWGRQTQPTVRDEATREAERKSVIQPIESDVKKEEEVDLKPKTQESMMRRPSLMMA